MQVGEGMGKLVYYRTGVDMPRLKIRTSLLSDLGSIFLFPSDLCHVYLL